MAELPQGLADAIGRETDPVTYVVEEGAVLRFADAIGDPSPLYRDRGYAARSPYGGIIAPPNFFGWPEKGMSQDMVVFRQRTSFLLQFAWPLPQEAFFPHPPPGAKHIINMGNEVEYFRRIRAGERLTVRSRVVDVFQRQGPRFGNMVFVVVETTFRDQAGEPVARFRGTMMSH